MRRSSAQYQPGLFDTKEARLWDAAPQVFQQPEAVADPFAAAVRAYLEMLDEHNAAMVRGDVQHVMDVRRRAASLAEGLNGGTRMGVADVYNDLETATAAPAAQVPLWGQKGTFDYWIPIWGPKGPNYDTLHRMQMRVTIRGMLYMGGTFHYWPYFETHAIEWDKPFLSSTGYRSFFSRLDEQAITKPDEFVRLTVVEYLWAELSVKIPRKRGEPKPAKGQEPRYIKLETIEDAERRKGYHDQ